MKLTNQGKVIFYNVLLKLFVASQKSIYWLKPRLAKGYKGVPGNFVPSCEKPLLKNKLRLKYSEALQAGFPIATGVIEGACRHLINDRLDITGARWSLNGAEALLKLRSLKSSGDFDDYWGFHKQQEKLRNYPFLQNN